MHENLRPFRGLGMRYSRRCLSAKILSADLAIHENPTFGGGKHCICELGRSGKEQTGSAILDSGDVNLNLKTVTPKIFHFVARDYTLRDLGWQKIIGS
jgi:hypothetical protein